MRAEFKLGRAKRGCNHILKLGEVALQEIDERGVSYRTVVGDGKTPMNDLPSLADYDLHERVVRLEREVKELKSRCLDLTQENDAHYSCSLGDFYKIFAQKDDSWEFKAKKILSEEEMLGALEALRKLKGGTVPNGSR